MVLNGNGDNVSTCIPKEVKITTSDGNVACYLGVSLMEGICFSTCMAHSGVFASVGVIF